MADARSFLPAAPQAEPDLFARRGFRVSVVALAAAAVLFLFWRAAGSLFLVFDGLLFAVFLDACTRGLGSIWNAARGLRLAIVCVLLVCLGIAGVSFGGYTIAQQGSELLATVQEQFQALTGEPAPRMGRGEGRPAQIGGQGEQGALAPAAAGQAEAGGNGDGLSSVLRRFFPSVGALLRSATTMLGGVAGVLGNVVVILFLGLYVAIDPALYRRGALLVVPPGKRERVGAVLDESAETLRWWIVGQIVSMSIVTLLTFVALLLVGMPAAFTLALITGLFAFIPYIGSFVAGAVIVLVGLAQGGTMVFWALGVYMLVQLVESYVLAPVVERWSVSLAPALIIGGLTVLGALFGIWGFILAAPLLAVIRLFVLRFWVEDALGERQRA